MSDLTVMAALQGVVLNISPSIIPTTTLTADASGSGAVQVADSSRFMVGGRLWFADTLGEEGLAITGKTATSITLSFAGTGYSALQHTHTDGTTVYTNMQTEMPIEIAPSLAHGDPFIWISILKEQKRTVAQGGRGQSCYVARIQYHRLLNRPPTQQMDVNLWGERQQKAARTDLNTISRALTLNHHLVTENNGPVQDLGEGIGTVFITKQWQRLGDVRDTQQLAFALDVVVTDLLDPIS